MKLGRAIAGAIALALAAAPVGLVDPLLGTGVAAAQDSSVQAVSSHFTPEQAAGFSKQMERDLAAKGARVAMVFRAGRARDKLPEGIAYTHGAFWVHRTIKTATGEPAEGYAVYNLYAGDGDNWGKTESRLVQDWPFEFTRASTVDDMAVIIPSPEVQRRLLAVIDSPTYAKLHNPAYSLVSNPFERKYQNCNSFMLNVLGAAIWDTADPARIALDLKAHFKPTIVKTSAVVRLFGPIADQRLRTDDQKGPVRTVTYESLAGFLKTNGMLQETYVLNYRP
ncbi:hypothetical protein BH11PSE2_BH11PSE2_01570 [soil metagenome]